MSSKRKCIKQFFLCFLKSFMRLICNVKGSWKPLDKHLAVFVTNWQVFVVNLAGRVKQILATLVIDTLSDNQIYTTHGYLDFSRGLRQTFFYDLYFDVSFLDHAKYIFRALPNIAREGLGSWNGNVFLIFKLKFQHIVPHDLHNEIVKV